MNDPHADLSGRENLLTVSFEAIILNPFQPRKIFREKELQELARSIEQVGLLHPPLVRRSALLPGYYELISGERRFRALEILKWSSLPVVIAENPGLCVAQAALIENIQRSDLNPLEISEACRRLMIEKSWTQEQLAERLGKRRSTVAHFLRLLQLPDEVKESMQERKLTMGHAKEICSLSDPLEQIWLSRQIIEKGWSVRQTEKWVKKEKREKPPAPREKDIHTLQLEELLQQKLGTRVTISHKDKQGSIQIEYFGLDDLERILELMNLPP